MPKPRKCSFCGNDFAGGTGMMYIKNDGSILWFCSGKCKKELVTVWKRRAQAQMDNVLRQRRERKSLKPQLTRAAFDPQPFFAINFFRDFSKNHAALKFKKLFGSGE